MGLRNEVLLTAIVVGLIAGVVGGVVWDELFPKSQEDLIKEFYEIETAVSVSPHHIRKHIAQGDDSFLLVDLRSQEEYEREHIIGSVNVPAYASPEKSAYGEVDRIVSGFRALQTQYPGRDLIVYCYSIPCMTGRKMGKVLAEHEIYVKHLGVGWNEWRYDWTLWNHEHEWAETDVLAYVSSGTEPGEFAGADNGAEVCLPGGFGC